MEQLFEDLNRLAPEWDLKKRYPAGANPTLAEGDPYFQVQTRPVLNGLATDQPPGATVEEALKNAIVALTSKEQPAEV